MTETMLLERLVEEAGKRGRLEHQRDDLVAALDGANDGLRTLTVEKGDLLDKIAGYEKTVTRALNEASASVGREQHAIILLRDLAKVASEVADAPRAKGKKKQDLIFRLDAAAKRANQVLLGHRPF